MIDSKALEMKAKELRKLAELNPEISRDIMERVGMIEDKLSILKPSNLEEVVTSIEVKEQIDEINEEEILQKIMELSSLLSSEGLNKLKEMNFSIPLDMIDSVL